MGFKNIEPSLMARTIEIVVPIISIKLALGK